jgi:hypothetical protein
MPEVSSGQNIGGIINPPPIGGESNQIQISLLAFDKLVRIGVSGEVSSAPYNPAFEKWNAVAKCDIPVDILSNMFVFQTDHFDVNDLNPEDVRFYVDASQIPSTLNLASAVVGNGAVISVDALNQPLSSSDMVIGKDYVKHLANILFNTPFGVDLFINETDLVNSVNAGLVSIWNSCVSDLQNISTTGTNPALQGSPNHKYLLANSQTEDDNNTSKYNICRELYRMLISNAPCRFTDLPFIQVCEAQRAIIDPDAKNLYNLPLVIGDQILMRVVLKPSEQQSSFQNSQKDALVREDTRAYIIVLNLVECICECTCECTCEGECSGECKCECSTNSIM